MLLVLLLVADVLVVRLCADVLGDAVRRGDRRWEVGVVTVRNGEVEGVTTAAGA